MSADTPADKPRESDTPRTDAFMDVTSPIGFKGQAMVDLARQLERELHAMTLRCAAADRTANAAVARSAGTLLSEPTPEMIAAVSTIIQPYAAKLVWKRMLECAPRSSARTPIEETEESQGDWQCRDYADGWITFPTRKAAEKYQDQTGALMRYVRHYAKEKATDAVPSTKANHGR